MPSGRPVANRVILLPEQKAALQQIVHAKTEPLRRIQRAEALLAAAQGCPQKAIAEAVGLSVSAVARLLRKAHQVGPISALEDLHRCGRPRALTEEARQWIKSLAGVSPKTLPDGPAHALWSVASLTAYVRTHACQTSLSPALDKVSKSTIWNILAEDRALPQRIPYQLEKRTPVRAAPKDGTLLLHTRVDIEADLRCASSPAAMRPGGRQTVKMTLFAAIDIVTGKTHVLVREHAAGLDFVDFLQSVDVKCPAESAVFMMLDKRFLPSSSETKTYLDGRKNRFQFIFLPKQGSCLNLVEIFFHQMVRAGLSGLEVSSADELKSRVTRWVSECADVVPV